MMTNAELIAKLQALPQDKFVKLYTYQGQEDVQDVALSDEDDGKSILISYHDIFRPDPDDFDDDYDGDL